MSLLRNTFTQSSFTFISRILGLLRDLVITARIGAGPVGDAFFTALQFPNLFRRILAEGAFSQAFVPAYARILDEKGDEEAQRVASEMLSILFTVTAFLTLLLILLMPWIMIVLLQVYHNNGPIFSLAILMTQITMPYLIAMSMGSLFAGILNTAGKFALTAAAPTLLNICMIGALFWEGSKSEIAIAGAIAVTVSGALQLALLYFGARQQNVRLHLKLPKLSEDVKRILWVAAPGALAASATQINILVSQIFAGLEEGSKSYLAVADRLYQLPLGLVGVAIGVAILPGLSRAVRREEAGSMALDDVSSKQHLDNGVVLALLLCLPASFALIAIPEFLLNGLFVRGAFEAADAQATAMALMHFAWGVPAFVLIKILAPAFFARQDTVRPMRFALISVGTNIVVGATLFWQIKMATGSGYMGLAMATSFSAWVNLILLCRALKARDYYEISTTLWAVIMRIALASLLMALSIWGLVSVYSDILGALGPYKEIRLLAVIATGAILYVLLALILVGPKQIGLKNLSNRA